MMLDGVARMVLTISESLELSIVAKATIVLGLALLAVRLARHARASVRHVVLASAFGVLLTLPSGDVGMGIQASPGGLRARNVTVRLLMRTAYRIQDSQLAGGPDWLDSERFDIVAKSEGNASVDQLSLMMRALLADRFKLVVHKESRERPIYTLVVARSDGRLGPQLQRRDCVPAPLATAPGANQQLQCGIIETGSGRVNFRGALMSQIAEGLSGFVGRVVLDRTGLSGNYDLNLQWTPELWAPLNQQPGSDVKAIDPDGQSIFTAVQEQLGFKLQPTQGPVDVLVIDHVELPIPN